MTVEARLRRAIDGNVGWYDAIFGLHGIGALLADGLWSALGPPPPYHSHAVVVEPSVTLDTVEARIGEIPNAGFKDAYASLDAMRLGMAVLFEATWIHREPGAPTAGDPSAWTDVRTPDQLAAWNAGWDTADVLIPAVLDRAAFRVMARIADGEIVAGAVARLGTGAVDVSNVHGVGDHVVDWAQLTAAIAARFPDRPMVGYEHGKDLEDAMRDGWDAVGPLRVWVR
ncbi:MAG: hypothetical protein ACRDFY_05920 [Candidatus Limnocylindria bacterium]